MCKDNEVSCWVSLTHVCGGYQYYCIVDKYRSLYSFGCGILEEAWTGKKVSYSFLKTFGCETFAQIDSKNRTKLEAKSKKCVFVGYGIDEFHYRLWNFENHKIVRSRDVIFNEKVLYRDLLQQHEKK